jgi:hypothetical protein
VEQTAYSNSELSRLFTQGDFNSSQKEGKNRDSSVGVATRLLAGLSGF